MRVRWTGKAAGNKSASMLAGIAIAGVLTTAVLAISADRKAVKKTTDDAAPASEEKFQDNWMLYGPAGVAFWVTVACIIQSNRLNRRRSKAILTAYIVEPFFSDTSAN